MSYVVLARKWRPMSFRDLIGQEHVSRTLANAIEQQRVAHAFLFTGVRGVGKTTSARILAKALNCLQPGSGGDARGLEPCLACAACREIAEGNDVDVREIDGASYTGVDEIRKLQESLPYRPTRDRYKIFIVDEVHMLSQNAWNALLKTLEEPPPHVKFILATTEVHKVPVTILSRVQRFDFKMIPSRLIAERIRYVLDNEHIGADERAVALVAREARGSMRDALSLLDQVIAFNSKQLLGDEVSRVLGLAGYATLLDLAAAVLNGQPPRVLEGVLGLSNQGCDITVVAKDLLAVFRDLVVAKLCKDTDELLDLSDEEQRRVRDLASGIDTNDLMRVQQGFAKGFDDVSRSAEPRAALEMLLSRLALRPELLPLDGMLARLTELEARLATGKPPPPAQRSGPAGGSPRGGNPRPAVSQTATVSEDKPAPRAAPAAVAMSSHAVPRPPATPQPVPVPQTTPRAAPPISVAPVNPAPQSSAPPEPIPAGLLEDWRRVLDCLGQTRPDLVAFLNHTVPLEISAELFTLGYEAGNALEARTRSTECLEALRAAARTCFGREPQIVFQPVGAGRQTLAESDKRARELQKKAAVDRAEQHPSVRDAAEILGARVKRIEVSEG